METQYGHIHGNRLKPNILVEYTNCDAASNLLIYLRGDSAVSCLTMASRLTCLVLYKGFQIVRFACVELVGQALVLFIFNFFLRKFFYFLFVAICRLLLLLRTKAHFRSRLQFSVLQDGNHYSIRMRLY